jgi:hypothetical protein
MDEQTEKLTEGWIDGWTNRWTDGKMDRWRDGQTVSQTGRWMGEQTDE